MEFWKGNSFGEQYVNAPLRFQEALDIVFENLPEADLQYLAGVLARISLTGTLPIPACLQVDWRRCANGDATIVVMAGVQDVTIQYDLGTVLFAVSCLPSSCYSLQ